MNYFSTIINYKYISILLFYHDIKRYGVTNFSFMAQNYHVCVNTSDDTKLK